MNGDSDSNLVLQMRCHPAHVFGAGPSDIQQAKFKSLVPALKACAG